VSLFAVAAGLTAANRRTLLQLSTLGQTDGQTDGRRSITQTLLRTVNKLLKGKVFPYSLPSVGPGADPGVQAVSPQVT